MGRLLKSTGLALGFAAVSSGLFAQQTVKEMSEPLNTGILSLFDMWRPLSVEQSETTLTVKLPFEQVSDDMFYGAMTMGLCFGLVRDIDISDVETFELVNETGDQGWVAEGGAEKCAAVLDTTFRSEFDALLSPQIRSY